jgi:hypothetical protein
VVRCGDPKDGDLEGGISLGFLRQEVADEEWRWSVRLANDLAAGPMTEDVTPRRCQRFKVPGGGVVSWATSAGQSGKATADAAGLVTVPRVQLRPGAEVMLTITR